MKISRSDAVEAVRQKLREMGLPIRDDQSYREPGFTVELAHEGREMWSFRTHDPNTLIVRWGRGFAHLTASEVSAKRKFKDDGTVHLDDKFWDRVKAIYSKVQEALAREARKEEYAARIRNIVNELNQEIELPSGFYDLKAETETHFTLRLYALSREQVLAVSKVLRAGS